jgi:hypothetical protein
MPSPNVAPQRSILSVRIETLIRAGLAGVLAVLAISGLPPAIASATPPSAPLVLAPAAGVPPTPSVCFATIDGVSIFSSVNFIAVQQAVNAATPNDTVKVAGACLGFQTLAGTNQTVYISKTLTLQGGYTNTLSGWLFSDPVANPTVLDAQAGGRVIFATAPVTISGLTVQNGRAGTNNDGGGVFVAPSASSVTISATQILSNTAGRSGGGVAISGTTASRVSALFIDTTLRANTALTNGGGIVASTNTTVTLSNAQFITNTAGQDGGGAFLDGRVDDSGSTFAQNFAGGTAINRGAGGLYARSATLTNTQFLTNTAVSFGGGLIMLDELVMNGGLFAGNTALRAGGLYGQRNNWTLTGTQFIANSATSNGGGAIYLNNSGGTQFANLINLWVERNTSGNFAGGLFINSPNTTSITGSTFLSNTAPNVGAISTGSGAANGTLLIQNSRFEGNQSTAQNAGALQSSRPAQTVISKTAFLRNTAAADAGAVQVTSGSAQLVNNLFAGNTAGSTLGAAAYLSSTGAFTLWHNTFAGSAVNAGSAVHIVNGSAQLRNNIVASYTTGINVVAGTGSEDNTLFDSVTTPRAGIGAGANSVIGAAAFVSPASDDYKFTASSQAINLGTALSVSDDFFGNPRPQQTLPDAGYFESPFVPVLACNTEINGDNLTDFSSNDANAVQQAVDAVAANGTVKVAGTCAGVQTRAGTTQTVYISTPLTLEGGYTATNWLAASDPATHPSVLDALAGGRVIVAMAAMTASNLIVQNGKGNGDGGGASFNGATSLTNTTFISNTSTGSGGGAVISMTVAQIVNTRFVSNTAGASGGGLALLMTTVQLTNTDFFSNTANGLSIHNGGGGLWSNGAIEQSGGTYAGNKTARNGGGVQAAGGFTLTSVSFISNTAAFEGGGAHQFASSGPLPSNVTSATFQNNRANGGNGGALYAYANPFVLSGTQVLSNSATGTGGGVFNYAGTRILNSLVQNNNARAVFSRNALEIAGSHFISNTGSSGGAAFSDGGGVTLSDSTFERNSGQGSSGGAIYAGSNYGAAFANITNSIFLSNTGGAGATVFANFGPITVTSSRFENSTGSDSGGVLFTNNIVVVSDSQFISNTSGTGAGGAIFAFAGLTVTNSHFEWHAGGTGGTLFSNGTVSIDNATFITSTSGVNTGSPGGTLFAGNGAVVQNSRFENSSSGGPGGAIFSNNPVVLTNTDFISNSANAIGGAVFGRVNVTGGRFERNAGTGGGAIWGHAGATSVITGATFISNSASSIGGGAVWANQTAEVRNSTFTGNTSGNHAGALWTQGASTIDGVTFTGNAVTSTFGGGALWANNVVTITHSSFMSNTSAGWAGGAFLQGAFVISRTQFVANSSSWSGGGLMRGGFSGKGQIVNSVFSRNSAGRGAAIDIATGDRVDILFTSISSAPAGIGAAIFVTNSSQVNITNSIVTSHNVGIEQSGSSVVNSDDNLFFGNTNDTQGMVVTGSNSVMGDPAFVDATNDNLRLTLASAAINQGNGALGVSDDFDGNARPFGPQVDIGAFEAQANNQPPVADAGLPFSVSVNALTTLNGSASSDPESQPLTFGWAQVSGTPVTLSSNSVVSPTFSAPALTGTLVFQLIVTDSLGAASAPAFVTVTVSNGEPTADAGAPQTVFVNASVTLNGSASSDPENQTLTFGWSQVSGTPVTLSSNSVVSPTFSAPALTGTLVFQLIVTDSVGFASAPAFVTVTVEAEPITIIPPTGAAITLTTGVALLGPSTEFTAALAGGTEPITFTWDFGDGSPIFTGPVASHVYAPGVYTATLTATNSAGTITTTLRVFVPWRMLLAIIVKDSTLPMVQQRR